MDKKGIQLVEEYFRLSFPVMVELFCLSGNVEYGDIELFTYRYMFLYMIFIILLIFNININANCFE